MRPTILLTPLLLAIALPPALHAQRLFGWPVSRMSASTVESPDKQWALSVADDPKGIPMLTLASRAGGAPQPLRYVQRSGWVLWSPDSNHFAFTDAAFADHYFVWLCSPTPSDSKCQDLSAAIESRFMKTVSPDSEVFRRYSKALMWLSSTKLILGLHAESARDAERRGNYTPVHYHFTAYVLDLAAANQLTDLPASTAAQQLGAPLDSLEW